MGGGWGGMAGCWRCSLTAWIRLRPPTSSASPCCQVAACVSASGGGRRRGAFIRSKCVGDAQPLPCCARLFPLPPPPTTPHLQSSVRALPLSWPPSQTHALRAGLRQAILRPCSSSHRSRVMGGCSPLVFGHMICRVCIPPGSMCAAFALRVAGNLGAWASFRVRPSFLMGMTRVLVLPLSGCSSHTHAVANCRLVGRVWLAPWAMTHVGGLPRGCLGGAPDWQLRPDVGAAPPERGHRSPLV